MMASGSKSKKGVASGCPGRLRALQWATTTAYRADLCRIRLLADCQHLLVGARPAPELGEPDVGKRMGTIYGA